VQITATWTPLRPPPMFVCDAILLRVNHKEAFHERDSESTQPASDLGRLQKRPSHLWDFKASPCFAPLLCVVECSLSVSGVKSALAASCCDGSTITATVL
jgi:hypothetical protein